MEKKKYEPWYVNLFRFLFLLGLLAAVIWMLDSCEKENRKEQKEREDEIYQEMQREQEAAVEEAELDAWTAVVEHMRKYNPSADLFTYYPTPEDLRKDFEAGDYSAEELIEFYTDFWNSAYDAFGKGGWEDYCNWVGNAYGDYR